MTARADAARRRAAIRLGGAAAVAAALAFALVARDVAARRVDTVEGPVAPRWAAERGEARTIRVASRAGELTAERGEDGVWTLAERAGHPVDPAALAALDRSLEGLRFSGARSGDPANYERLGVGDPAEGGEGVRLTVSGAGGAVLEDLIFGAKRQESRGGGAFLRRPGEAQTYAAIGEIPDLASPALWIDLDFLGVARADLAEVVITPEGEGPAYRLVRGAPAGSDFALAEPTKGWDLITAGAANVSGAGLAELRFEDVRPAGSLGAPRAGRHEARTFDGLVIALDLYRIGEGAGAQYWATVEAKAGEGAAPDAAAKAEALTQQTGGWAYELPEGAGARLIRPLTDIARQDPPLEKLPQK